MRLPRLLRRKGRTKTRLSTFQAGLLGIVAIVVFSYLAYTKFANPFASQFTVHAIFSSANGLRPDSLVRIAGINVGRVTDVAPFSSCKVNGTTQKQCQAADVTMEIQDSGLPLHDDATFAIRPRIFLEGNFFVDVHPGTPGSPVAHDGHVFPIQQGTEPVQLDQVLTSLQGDTRHNLQLLLKGYGTAVKRGGASYNASIPFWLPAYEYSAIVAHDALGIQPHDLSNWIARMGTVSAAIDAHPRNLQNLITDFNTTASSFASESAALQESVAELPRTLQTAIPAFNALNAAFPPLRAFARALIPGVKSAGPAIDASLPFITQLRLLVRPQELRGLTGDLSVTIPALANLTKTTIPFMRDQVRPASSCVANVVYPWSQLTLNDPNFNADNGFPARKAFVEAVDFLPGLAGESRDFDANGPYIRILGTGGTFTYSLQPGMFGQALTKIVSVQPQLPPGGHRPPLQPNVPCETQQAITDLSAPAGAPPQQVGSDLAAPGASLRWQDAAQAAVGMLRDVSRQQGLNLNVPRSLFGNGTGGWSSNGSGSTKP
jgi:phospholipid/cholesterol/gamma-HCH transport system substrate-binding protein